MCKGPAVTLQLLHPLAPVALLCPGPEHPWVHPPTEGSQAAVLPAPSTWFCLDGGWGRGAVGAGLQPPDKMRRRRDEMFPAASPVSCPWAGEQRRGHVTGPRGGKRDWFHWTTSASKPGESRA